MRAWLCGAILTGCALAAAGAPAAAQASTFLEAVSVANNATAPVLSNSSLDPSHYYQMYVTGTASDWCPTTAQSATDCSNGSPFDPGADVDALYCYATWRCPTPQEWHSLLANGVGLDQLGTSPTAIQYATSHSYLVTFHGVSGRLSFTPADGSPEDNSGGWTVQLSDIGTQPPDSGTPAPAPAPAPAPVASVGKIVGSVEIQQNDGAWQPLTSSTRIGNGDRIHTKYKSSVTVTFADGHVMTVKPLSLVVIGETGAQTRVFLRLGEVSIGVNKRNVAASDFVPRTPTTTASVRGTRFTMAYARGLTVIHVTQGKVFVVAVHHRKGQLRSALLTAGHGARITSVGVTLTRP